MISSLCKSTGGAICQRMISWFHMQWRASRLETKQVSMYTGTVLVNECPIAYHNTWEPWGALSGFEVEIATILNSRPNHDNHNLPFWQHKKRPNISSFMRLFSKSFVLGAPMPNYLLTSISQRHHHPVHTCIAHVRPHFGSAIKEPIRLLLALSDVQSKHLFFRFWKYLLCDLNWTKVFSQMYSLNSWMNALNLPPTAICALQWPQS